MSHDLQAIRRLVASQPWAMIPEHLEAMLEWLQLRADGVRFTAEEVDERLAKWRTGPVAAAPATRGVAPSSGAIAVIPIRGVIMHREPEMRLSSGGLASTERIRQQFNAAIADPNVSAVVLDIDSPGGQVTGVEETWQTIFNGRDSGKRIVASVNGVAASAAYYIASAAPEIAVNPSGEVGAIGVYMVHQDMSGALAQAGVKTTLIKAGKYKAEGHPTEPLTEEARAAIAERVDEAYGMFTKAVARGRAVPIADVRNGFGEGRVVGARKALDLGMVDRIATIDEIVSRLGSTKGGAKPGGRRADALERRRLDLADKAPLL